uniref:Uncharacterized protein n=1 Tax=Branchiostoma floridae TaxID=7739 RepID=C3XXF4_BRAFL|eukprot:XP_002611404.1 hypothetical protein BRAFLDRAFT_63968 [Branchiostoma floridae]
MGSPEVTDTDIPGDEVPRHIRSVDDLMCHVNDVWHSCSRLANQNVELRLELAEVTWERDRRKGKMATLHTDEFPGKIVLWRKMMKLQAELDESRSRCGDLERRKLFLELNIDDLERMVAKLQFDVRHPLKFLRQNVKLVCFPGSDIFSRPYSLLARDSS